MLQTSIIFVHFALSVNIQAINSENKIQYAEILMYKGFYISQNITTLFCCFFL